MNFQTLKTESNNLLDSSNSLRKTYLYSNDLKIKISFFLWEGGGKLDLPRPLALFFLLNFQTLKTKNNSILVSSNDFRKI